MAEIAPLASVVLILALLIAEPVSLHFEKNEKFTLTVSLAIFALSFSTGGKAEKAQGKKEKKKKRRIPVQALPSVTRVAAFLLRKARVRVNALTYCLGTDDFVTATIARARLLSLFSAAVAFIDEQSGELIIAESVPAFSSERNFATPGISFDITVDFLLVYLPAALILFLFDTVKRGARRSARR